MKRLCATTGIITTCTELHNKDIDHLVHAQLVYRKSPQSSLDHESLCATTGMQKNTTGTSTTTCTATGESVKGLPLRRDRKDGDAVDKLRLRNLHSLLHVKCHLGKSGVERHPARELRHVRINVATFTPQTRRAQYNTELALGCRSQLPTHTGKEDRHQKTHTPPNP